MQREVSVRSIGGKLKSSPPFLAWEGRGERRRIDERTAVERMGTRLFSFAASRWVLKRVVRWADGAKARDSGDRMVSTRPTRAAVLTIVGR